MITLIENLILKIKKSFSLKLNIKFRGNLSVGYDENSSVCKVTEQPAHLFIDIFEALKC